MFTSVSTECSRFLSVRKVPHTLPGIDSVVFVLVSLVQRMSGSRLKWFTDSQGVARIVQVGSMHFSLHNLATDIFSFCSNHGINLDIK